MANEALERLGLFESRDIVAEQCRAVTGRSPNAEHAREIASHVMQGRQYLDAARVAGDLVRPLLVYYAALALVRGVVMFRLHRREAALKPSHGLGARDWGGTLATEGLDGLRALRIETENGTFAELASATANTESVNFFIGPYPSFTRVTRTGSIDVVARAFTLGEVWSRIPELQRMRAVAYPRDFDCWPTFAFFLSGHHLDLELYQLEDAVPDVERVRALLGRNDVDATVRAWGPLASNYARFVPDARGNTTHVRVPCAEDAALVAISARFTQDADGRLFLRRPLSTDLMLSPLSLIVIASYAAGMLVRYHATKWNELVRHGKGDRALSIIRKTVAIAEENLPTLIVDALMMPMPGGAQPTPAAIPTPNSEVL